MSAAAPYDLQRLYEEKTGGLFQFTWADQVWTLPSMRMLDIAVQERIENLGATDETNSVETVNELFDEIMGEEQGARWQQVVRPLPMLIELFRAWTEHSKSALGEAPASAGSSQSMGRPSKRTSNGSTASASRKPSSPRARKSATPRVSS